MMAQSLVRHGMKHFHGVFLTGEKKPGIHRPGVMNIGKGVQMDYNQPDSDNQVSG